MTCIVSVRCIEEGRLIYTNLLKTIAYQIAGGSWGQLLPILSTFLLGLPPPLSPILMIVISCACDVFGGMALMHESPDIHLMAARPKFVNPTRYVRFRLVLYSYLFMGNLQLVGAFLNYFLYMSERGPQFQSTPLPDDDAKSADTVYPVGKSNHMCD